MIIQKENPETEVALFFMAETVECAIHNQTTLSGYLNIEIMMKSVIKKVADVKACGTCMDARGFKDIKLMDGVERSNMKELTDLTLAADKVITF
ncbi:MAG: hypothetical protein SCALA702_01910 [Melioribacteraceae bacterium]|nr:MAG: hypothetical protein SCALA702_01910 [Melioribacteraceae bacterium]